MKIKTRKAAGIILLAAATLGISLSQSLKAADYTAELAAVAALGDLTTAPAIYTDDTLPGTPATVAAGDLKTIYFDALDYLGNPTRVYAWVGIPAGATAGNPVPGVVLVHGGGGTAFQTWVTKWRDRGYAAISIAVEGQTDSTTPPTINTGWHIHDMPGPIRSGIYGDSAVSPISNQWMYHAVADTVLANSLLRSLPEVDANKVGVMGVSWGGIITSTAIGIDTRFKFAVPTYGCGHLFDARNAYGGTLGSKELYKEVWDPMVRIANANMPVLWYSWPQDAHFPMENLAYTYHGATGSRMVSLVPGMGHGHGAAWNRPESYDFADSIVGVGNAPWCEQQSLNLVGNTATVEFTSAKSLHTANLVYRTSHRPNISNVVVESPDPWTVVAADSLVEGPAGTWTVSATLPAGVTGWFVNLEAAGVPGNPYGYVDADLTASSDYQEKIDLILTPGGGLEIDHPLSENQSTGTMNLAFTGPGNLEVVDVQISSESHLGAFTDLATLPLVVDNPTPASSSVQIQFDNTVAGLSAGQTATGIVSVVWANLDGSTEEATLPVSATALTPATVIYDSTANWFSKTVTALDDVIIRNGATATVDQPATSNLIVNGNFETPDVAADGDPSPNGFTGFPIGNTNLTGWTISGNTVYAIDGFDNFNNDLNAVASDGDQFVQLQFNSSPATISQTFTTVVGQDYQLDFDYSALDFINSRSVTLTYNLGGSDQTIDYTTIDLNVGQTAWETESVAFTATGTSTTISFTGDFISGFWGPSIDNVRVTETTPTVAVANITVNDDPSPITATLRIDQDVELAATASIQLGVGTGAGTVNQSAGSVTAANLTVNSSGTGDLSQYNLSGGTVSLSDTLTVNAPGEFNLSSGSLMLPQDGGVKIKSGGLLDIDGGTLIKDFNGSTIVGTLGGAGDDGTILVQSGALQLVNGTVTAAVDLRPMLEIRGGDVDIFAQARLRNELKVVGDAASIDIGWMGTFAGSDLVFEFDETGVSPVNVSGWMSLSNTLLTVDGSGYTGSAGTHTLLDSANLASKVDSGNITIIGFSEQGLNATVEQDDLVEERVQLVVTVSPYGTWATGYGLSGSGAFASADPDEDEIKNLMEFALGGDPTVSSDRGTLPTLNNSGGGAEFTYVRRVNPSTQGLLYTVKSTRDLSLPSSGWGTDGLGTPTVTPIDSEFELVAVPVSTTGVSARFVHLEILLLE